MRELDMLKWIPNQVIQEMVIVHLDLSDCPAAKQSNLGSRWNWKTSRRLHGDEHPFSAEKDQDAEWI
jgi:hypothetical protein